jgi:hypothetical protein
MTSGVGIFWGDRGQLMISTLLGADGVTGGRLVSAPL